MDAPPRKTKNPQPKRTPGQDHHINLRLNRHNAERASFGAPREEDPKQQAMMTAVRQETGEGRNQRAPKVYRRRPRRPQKPMAPNRGVGPIKGEGKLRLPPR